MVAEPLTFSKLLLANVGRSCAPKPQGFNHPLDKWSVLEWGGAASGEFGEACNVAKKLLRFRDNLAGNRPGETRELLRHKLGCEIADGVHYAVLWAASEKIDLDNMLRYVFNKKSEEIGSDFRI